MSNEVYCQECYGEMHLTKDGVFRCVSGDCMGLSIGITQAGMSKLFCFFAESVERGSTLRIVEKTHGKDPVDGDWLKALDEVYPILGEILLGKMDEEEDV